MSDRRPKSKVRNPRSESFNNGEIKHRDIRKTYTTGQISRLLDTSPRTVSKMIDSGALPGYRLPSSTDRRVHHNDLLKFLWERELPQYHDLMRASVRVVLLVGCDDKVKKICERPEWVSYVASDGFTAGSLYQKHSPEMVVVDSGSIGKHIALELGKATSLQNPPTHTLAIIPEDQTREDYTEVFTSVVSSPVDPTFLALTLENILKDV